MENPDEADGSGGIDSDRAINTGLHEEIRRALGPTYISSTSALPQPSHRPDRSLHHHHRTGVGHSSNTALLEHQLLPHLPPTKSTNSPPTKTNPADPKAKPVGHKRKRTDWYPIHEPGSFHCLSIYRIFWTTSIFSSIISWFSWFGYTLFIIIIDQIRSSPLNPHQSLISSHFLSSFFSAG